MSAIEGSYRMILPTVSVYLKQHDSWSSAHMQSSVHVVWLCWCLTSSQWVYFAAVIPVLKLPAVLSQSQRSSVYTRSTWTSSTVAWPNQMRMRRRSTFLCIFLSYFQSWFHFVGFLFISVNVGLTLLFKIGIVYFYMVYIYFLENLNGL